MTKDKWSKFIPPCVIFDHAQYSDPISCGDAIAILQFEIDLAEEGEDGALQGADIESVRECLRKVRVMAAQ
jgi:hypothetical protein